MYRLIFMPHGQHSLLFSLFRSSMSHYLNIIPSFRVSLFMLIAHKRRVVPVPNMAMVDIGLDMR
jgi:hypothetical protein